MVILDVKGEMEEDEFLYECSAKATIEDILSATVSIQNLRYEVRHLSARLRELFFEDSLPETWTEPKIHLYRLVSEAETYTSKEQVLHGRPLLLHILGDHVQGLKSEITTSPLTKPSGVDLEQLMTGLILLNFERTQLLWIGKELQRGKRLCDYIGTNEKTKVTVRLQLASSDTGSPSPSSRLLH